MNRLSYREETCLMWLRATSYHGFITPFNMAVDTENAAPGIVAILLDNFDKEAMDALSINGRMNPELHRAADRKNLDVVRLLL